MFHFRTAQKEKKLAFFFIFALSLGIIISLIYVITTFTKDHSNNTRVTARIYYKGQLHQEISLWKVETPYTITLSNGEGSENTIWVSSNNIGIISSTCPDQICVAMGICSHSPLPITCLPNEVMIVLQEDDTPMYDMTTY